MKILLLQARHQNDQARLDERNSFAQKAKLTPDAFTPYDLLSGTPTMTEIKDYDALMIGGSGDYYVSKRNLPNNDAVLDILREVTAAGHPTFASCFGFHLLVEALGGKVVYDIDHMEVGTYEIHLNEAGRSDELFSSMPDRFAAQLGHKDRAEILPSTVRSLASSESALYQAIRIPGKPIWATQFHPELSGKENLARFYRYMDGYAGAMDEKEIQSTLARFSDSPDADNLIGRFLEIVFK